MTKTKTSVTTNSADVRRDARRGWKSERNPTRNFK